MTATIDLPATPDDSLQCMDIWGGHRPADHHFTRPGLDVWIWSRTHDRVPPGGGDLYMLSSCASGRITRLLLADICGYGPLFTQIADELRDLMKRNLNTIQQARFVRQMSCQLEEASERGGFASTLISTFFAPTRSLTMCNAGHPPPLLYRKATNEWSPLKQVSGRTPPESALPGVIDPVEYQQLETKLEVGDLMLSFSNSLTECRDANGRTLGLHGILNRARRLDVQNPAVLGRQLAAEICRENAENLVDDDATVVVCGGTKTRPSLRDNFLAPLRLLRGPVIKTVI